LGPHPAAIERHAAVIEVFELSFSFGSDRSSEGGAAAGGTIAE
jgi:hypothetical protein